MEQSNARVVKVIAAREVSIDLFAFALNESIFCERQIQLCFRLYLLFSQLVDFPSWELICPMDL